MLMEQHVNVFFPPLQHIVGNQQPRTGQPLAPVSSSVHYCKNKGYQCINCVKN